MDPAAERMMACVAEAGDTIEIFAEKMGKSQYWAYCLAQGMAMPSIDEVFRFSELYNVSPYYIGTGE